MSTMTTTTTTTTTTFTITNTVTTMTTTTTRLLLSTAAATATAYIMYSYCYYDHQLYVFILTKENVEGKAREKTPEELRLEADRQTPGKVYRVVLQSVASGLFWGCIRVGGL